MVLETFSRLWPLPRYRKLKVSMMPTLSSLATTSCATMDDEVGIMTTLRFQCKEPIDKIIKKEIFMQESVLNRHYCTGVRLCCHHLSDRKHIYAVGVNWTYPPFIILPFCWIIQEQLTFQTSSYYSTGANTIRTWPVVIPVWYGYV